MTTGEMDLLASPDLAAAKLSGGQLSKGTVVKIAPQDWWYVEVERPATASGVLRGWVSNASLRQASAADLAAAPPPLAEPAPPLPADPAQHAALRKKMRNRLCNSKDVGTRKGISVSKSSQPATGAAAMR
ncbi:MAG: hypothetical protein ABIR29_06500 [Chthoniobacterales bacterium]